MKKFYFLVLLSHAVFAQGIYEQKGQTLYGEFANARFGSPSQVNEDGNIIAVSGPSSQAVEYRAGYVKVFEIVNNEWVQLGEDILGSQNYSQFGYSISLSADGTTLAIGAPGYENNTLSSTGLVQVYKFDGSTWNQIGQDLYGDLENDGIGGSISMNADGDRIVFNASSEDFGIGAGRVQVYEYNYNAWQQVGSTIEGEEFSDQFGSSVKINSEGDVIVVGAKSSNANGQDSGAAYVYKFLNDDWVAVGDRISGKSDSDRFGTEVDINSIGNIIAVGAPFNSDINSEGGSIRVFREVEGNWVQLGNEIYGTQDFENLNLARVDATGFKLGISSISNHGNGTYRGVVYMLQLVDDNWVKVLSDIEGVDYDRFGMGFSMNSLATVLTGGQVFDDTQGYNAGRVEVYNISTEGIPELICSENYTQEVVGDNCEAIVSYEIPTAQDPEDGNLQVTLVEGLPSGSSFPVGTTTVTYTATDSSNITNSCSFTVTVIENIPPEVTCPDDLTINAAQGNDFIILQNYINSSDTDNCGGLVESIQTPPPSTVVEVGESVTVTITNTDKVGNEASCSFTVTAEAPLSVNKESLKRAVTIYPNAFQDYINIEISKDIEIVACSLIDIKGRVIKTITPSKKQSILRFKSGAISSGGYFLSIRSTQTSVVKQIIKL